LPHFATSRRIDLPEVVAAAKGVVDAIAVDAEDGRNLAHLTCR
jgi:hypothetical protein